MAPPNAKGSKRALSRWSPTAMSEKIRLLSRFFTMSFVKKVFLSPSHTWILGSALLVAEIFALVAVIWNVKYTEIDWKAYMQEVEGVVNGTWDYYELKGDTGPLVYPAGFVYFFLGLYHATNAGTNIRLAQYFFAGFYIITLFLVIRLYNRSYKIPPYVLIFLCCTSYRIHSIFVLRLFNDPVATMFLYGALNCFMDQRWRIGSFLFSVAVSIKMNILLFAPALLLVYLVCLGLKETIVNLSICAGVQVVFALPFLAANSVAYIARSFDLGRVFLFEWTVNWRFLPEEIFVSRTFHVGLLLCHLVVLAVFAKVVWVRILKNYSKLANEVDLSFACQLLFLPLFASNFIGIAFARSLHYQFYVWYYHSLPYLLWSTPYSVFFRLLIFGVIEMCWNTYPSTEASSAALHVCHALILVGLWRNRPPLLSEVDKLYPDTASGAPEMPDLESIPNIDDVVSPEPKIAGGGETKVKKRAVRFSSDNVRSKKGKS